MDLKRIFEVQKVLRDRINYTEPDRFDKLVLALLVEVGECANEWRGFKFWSRMPFPQPPKHDWAVSDDGAEQYWEPGMGYTSYPLLEEYADGFTFLIEIGLEIGLDGFKPVELLSFQKNVVANDFKFIYQMASRLDLGFLLLDNTDYKTLFNNYLNIGQRLGFTLEEIEAAYYEKNKVNHDRQDSGY